MRREKKGTETLIRKLNLPVRTIGRPVAVLQSPLARLWRLNFTRSRSPVRRSRAVLLGPHAIAFVVAILSEVCQAKLGSLFLVVCPHQALAVAVVA